MISLANLTNTHRPKKKIQRVGRGVGSGRGKTCTRGHKGDKSRSGYKRHEGREGGQLPLHRKLPTRGFTRGLFHKESLAINLSLIERLYENGEIVNFETLRQKGIAPRELPGGIKILGSGELKKKVSIEANQYSEAAQAKLEKSGIKFTKV
ncbi:MAG: 50S ribosomal protein L15 [Verrucomicrobia bacterium]|nr:50S ribosomal protein L15 [Verrucomicrobiota bacterium]